MIKFLSKHEIYLLLGLKSPNSVKHYHKKWIEGIHYYKRPGGNRTGYHYNLQLIEHWQQCCEDLNNPDHQRLILEYQRSLNPLKRRKVG